MPLDEEVPVEGGEETLPDEETTEEAPGASEDAEEAPASEQTTPKLSTDALLADLKQRIDRGEITGDKLVFTQPKVQSSLAGKFNAIRKQVNDGLAPVVKAKGVTLPEGKTPFDLMSEGGDSWLNLQRELMAEVVDSKLGPLQSKLTEEEKEKVGAQKIAEALTVFPEFKENIQEICQTIVADPLMKQFSEVPEAIPLLIAGVGRDLEVQRMRPERDALRKENAELKAALKKAGIAIKTGGDTTKAKVTAPGKKTTGKGRSLADIAAANFDKIAAGSTAQ